jgi:hypothetical protein
MRQHQLPQPGPGRPHHPSYCEPGPQASLLELLVLIVGAALAFSAHGILTFLGGVL